MYALGVVAYEALAGVRPFNGENPIAVAMAHVRDEPPPLPPDIPPPVAALVMRMLTKDPARRFPDGGAVARAVAAVRGGARPATPGPITGAFPASPPTPGGPVTSTSGYPSSPPRAAYAPPGTFTAQAAFAPPAYAPPVRAATAASAVRAPAAYPVPAKRRTGIAVLVAVLVLVVVGVVGAILLNSAGTPGTSSDTSTVNSTTAPKGHAGTSPDPFGGLAVTPVDHPLGVGPAKAAGV